MATGETLRLLRRRSGLTQADVARRVGVTASVISAYENGRREPAADTFLAIVRASGFDSTFRPRLDPQVQARRLVQVLELAEALPYRPRAMASARLR